MTERGPGQADEPGSGRITCPQCGKRYRWQQRLAGRSVQCKGCGHTFMAPATPPGADSETGTIEAGPPAPPGTNACPSCGAALRTDALLCVQCGYNLKTGQTVAAGDPTGAPAAAGLTVRDIMRTPFDGEFVVAGLAVGIATAIYSGLMMLLVSVAVCFLSVIALVLTIVYLAWLSSQYLQMVERFEAGSLTAGDRSIWRDFGYFIVVTAVAWAPLLAGAVGAGMLGGVEPVVGGTVGMGLIAAGVVWGLVYWPMGIAQAGAYDRLNPAVVLDAIRANAAAYIVLLIYIVPLLVVALALEELVTVGVHAVMPGVAAAIAGLVLTAIVGQYAFCAQFAILGRLLRRQRLNQPATMRELQQSVPWLAGAVAACIVVLVVHTLIMNQAMWE